MVAAELHDERHKGSSDAYDLMAQAEGSDEFFPGEKDYRLMRLHRQRRDVQGLFPDRARDEAAALISEAIEQGGSQGTIAQVPVRMRLTRDPDGGILTLWIAFMQRPVQGSFSGEPIPLTDHRFLLLVATCRSALSQGRQTDEVLTDQVHDFPGGLANERAAVMVFASQ